MKMENSQLLGKIGELHQREVVAVKELKELECQKKELKNELKESINSVKKERRGKEQYLAFFNLTIPFEELEDKCKELEKEKVKESRLMHAYKQLKKREP
jgi:hypothetical protein